MRFLGPSIVLAAALALPASASDGTGVARVSVIAKGALTIQRGDDAKQLAATVNAPLLPGDFVATQPGTLAEVQLDGFTMLRLGENVQIRIVRNDSSRRDVQLAEGSIVLGVAHEQGGTTEIETPSVTLRALQPGDYRVSVSGDGTTMATARTGGAQIIAAGQTYDLRPGRTLMAHGPAGNPNFAYIPETPCDALDDFSAKRDRTIDAALNTDTYVPTDIAGFDDLDAYGKWIDLPSYGQVWVPKAPHGWAPYRDGRWVWEDGFGWTWVADEAWGWTPYHYGRWLYDETNGWCWIPPAVDAMPDWNPAMVAFFGVGESLGSAAGFDYLGWVPLAPFEPYYPWYPGAAAWHNHPYPQPLRHRPLPPVHFRNLSAGATGVEGSAFRAGNFSQSAAIDPSRLKNITVIRGALPVTPTAANQAFTLFAPAPQVQFSQTFAHFTAQPEVEHRMLRLQPASVVPVRAPNAPHAPAAPSTSAQSRPSSSHSASRPPRGR